MHILYTFLYSPESNTKLRIDAELSDHKNTVKIFTNFSHFFVIFLVLKKARMGQCVTIQRRDGTFVVPGRGQTTTNLCTVVAWVDRKPPLLSPPTASSADRTPTCW